MPYFNSNPLKHCIHVPKHFLIAKPQKPDPMSLNTMMKRVSGLDPPDYVVRAGQAPTDADMGFPATLLEILSTDQTS